MNTSPPARPPRWLPCLAVLLGLAGAPRAEAQENVPGLPPNPLLIQPGDSQPPAPDWVRPGMRLTYYSSAAVVPPGEDRYYRDAKGNYFDQQGNFYSRAAGGGAGHGYTQVTVSAVDAASAVLEVRSYSYRNFQGPLSLVGTVGAVGTPAAGSDWWVSPAILRQVQEIQTPTKAILRMGITLNGVTYQAIRFQVVGTDRILDTNVVTPDGNMTTQRGSRHVYVYDLATGLLLLGAHAVDIGKGIGLTRCQYVSARQLQVPWIASPPPPWLATVSALHYQGAQTIPFPGGRGAATMPITCRVDIRQRGATWAHYLLHFEVGRVKGFEAMGPTQSKAEGCCGPGQFGGIWVPPAALGALQAGQVLDQDPVTKVTVKVTQAGRAAGGANVVVISETNSIQQTDFTYDRATGLMMQMSRTDSQIQNINIQTVLNFVKYE